MQRVLEKMAAQLNAYDEASLMSLWQQYARQVSVFEPTKRWEEAALALSMIQAVRWKNQLFNYQLATNAAPPPGGDKPEMPSSFADFFTKSAAAAQVKGAGTKRPKATVLAFPGKGNS